MRRAAPSNALRNAQWLGALGGEAYEGAASTRRHAVGAAAEPWRFATTGTTTRQDRRDGAADDTLNSNKADAEWRKAWWRGSNIGSCFILSFRSGG